MLEMIKQLWINWLLHEIQSDFLLFIQNFQCSHKLKLMVFVDFDQLTFVKSAYDVSLFTVKRCWWFIVHAPVPWWRWSWSFVCCRCIVMVKMILWRWFCRLRLLWWWWWWWWCWWWWSWRWIIFGMNLSHKMSIKVVSMRHYCCVHSSMSEVIVCRGSWECWKNALWAEAVSNEGTHGWFEGSTHLPSTRHRDKTIN